MPGCCGLCSSWDLVPEGYNELSVAELQQLYAYSTNINDGRLIVQGLFARADCQNTNGRVYPKSILQREVARFKEQHVAKGSALGELNHPSYFSSYFRHLNLPNVSHQVLDLRWRGPELWGTLEVLPTPAGLLLSELYSKGIKLGVSSRGWASVVTDPHSKQVVVEPDYQLITFDFVPEPSNAGAYVVPICKRYRKRLPDQAAAVSISYLGIGSISMAHLQSLPPASVLRKWLKHTSRAMDAAAKHPGQLAAGSTAAAAALSSCAGAPPPQAGMSLTAPPAVQQGGSSSSSSSSNTHGVSMLGALGACSQQVLAADTPLGGGVVLGCHYQVLQKPWLPLDTAVRQFKVHLSLMATKARLHQQQQQHAGPVLDHSQLQQQQSLPRQQQPVQQQPQQQPQQQRFGSPQRQDQQQLQRLALEQPLLVRDPSDSSSSPSSQLPSVAGAEQGQPPGVVLPPAILAQVACDDAYSDSSLGPGTPKADPLVLLTQAPQQPQPPLPQQLLQQRQRVGVGAALRQASAC